MEIAVDHQWPAGCWLHGNIRRATQRDWRRNVAVVMFVAVKTLFIETFF
jgi:hypothetical protein